MIKFLVRILSTFFYVGYLPLIPGTFASLAGILVYMLIQGYALNYVLVTLLITITGFLVSGPAEKAMQRKDPPYIVIDEVSGMLLSLLFLPYDIRIIILAFILFRLLDTLKPYPAGSLEKLKAGAGIMADDLVAGIYTNIILQVSLRVISFKAS
ncbi:MAG: phosphatidylglycerophosphatase A [Candidatus Omnitrophica bacterium]|jgi:phosphatidylglycerophosphatase A|nr:phosphatidylglycerophosphatase A [Candidatus Omnitrophota bacterium]MDD3987393.1 phosphatidylglycerophosphatase A [Candidatus Omnitrophota bacterium]MDD5664620.1 phosphatidylglycerophosphatase A [Candidatus Omnitrophota bacterium]